MTLRRLFGKVRPDDPMRSGYEAYRRGDHARAAAEFRRAIERDAATPAAWLALARAHRNAGDLGASQVAACTALDVRPRWTPAIWHLADLAARRGDATDLEALLAELGDVRTLSRDDLEQAARLGIRAGSHSLVLLTTGALLETEPCAENVRFTRAVALHATGRGSEATQLVHDGQHSCGEAGLRTALRYAVHTGDVEWTDQLLRQVTPDADLLLELARMQRHRGELTAASTNLAHADQLRPADPRILQLRAVVDGERSVLTGSWSPPVLPSVDVDPYPGRVLHVVGRSEPHVHSGYTIRTQYIAKAQRDRGLDAHVVTRLDFPWSEGVGEVGALEYVDGVPYHRIRSDTVPNGSLQARLERSIDALFELVQELRPSVLHAASDYTNAFVAAAVARACSIPLVYEQRGFWEETWRSKQDRDAAVLSDRYIGRQRVERQALVAADLVVTLADVMAEELASRGVDRDRIRVVPNAVDPERFVPVDRDALLARAWGIAPDEVTVGYITSLVAYEGVRYLIDATAELRRAGLPVRAVIVGDGEDRSSLERRVAELGIRDHVTLTGRVPHEQIVAYYGLIDVFVVPRTGDRVCQLVTPLKPFEAMATGRPVVASDVAPLREIVQHGVTGFTFSTEDPNDLARSLRMLVLDPQLRSQIGRAARDWVATNRTWSANAERYDAIYAEVGALATTQT